jgi:Tfp pilus assembly PilM family ATPase
LANTLLYMVEQERYIHSEREDQPFRVLICICAKTTDFVAYNGETIWCRNIPLGGYRFTEVIEDCGIYSDAETRKRSDPTVAEIPRYHAVIADITTELQRSASYLVNISRGSEIGKVTLVGGAALSPGLLDHLKNETGWDMEPIPDKPEFAGAFGLALQAARKGKITTNLLPPRKSLFGKLNGVLSWDIGKYVPRVSIEWPRR